MKAARVLLVCSATALSLGSGVFAEASANHIDDAGFDGARTGVLTSSVPVARSSIEEQRSADESRARETASERALAGQRILQVGAGSAAIDTANGLASIPPLPLPSAASPPPPPSLPPPPSGNQGENVSSAPPTIIPAPSPTVPTPPPTPTLLPTPLPPTPTPETTSTLEPSPEPTSTPMPISTPSPTPDPISSTPVPSPPEPTSATSQPPSPTPSPSSSRDDFTPAPPTPSPTPQGNIIFDIRVVNSDERSAKKYTRSDKDTSSTPAPKQVSIGTTSGSSTAGSSAGNNENRSSGETSTRSTGTDATAGTQESDNVIGGKTRDNPVNAVTMSKDVAAFHNVIRYAACTFAGISVALLLFFHYASLDPRVDWLHSSTALLWSPNTWEFVLYLGYLQQMGSLSQLSLARAPYFLWDFTDSFAWSLFLVQRTGATATAARRLKAVVLTGVVAFGDRIGIDEASLLFLCSLAFLLVVGVLFVVYVVTVLLAKRNAEDKFDSVDNYAVVDPAAAHARVFGLRFVSLRFLGLCMLIWLFALYPLSLFASFEIAMQIDSGMLSAGPLMLAATVLGVVCLGVMMQCARELYRKTERELADVKNLAVWGSLYAAYTYRRRLFFVVVASVQLISGVLIGVMTATNAATALVVTLLVLQIVYLAAVFFQAGFISLSVGLFTFALSVIKIVNYALAFAFLESANASSGVRSRAATAFIMINSVVLIAWFVRHVIMLVLTIRALVQRERARDVDPYNANDNSSRYPQQHHTYLHDDSEEDDTDELVPEMVEFQTPNERDGGGSGECGGSDSIVMLEPKVSNVSEGQRGSNVYVTIMVSPAREREPSSHTESSSTSPPPLRSTIKMAL